MTFASNLGYQQLRQQPALHSIVNSLLYYITFDDTREILCELSKVLIQSLRMYHSTLSLISTPGWSENTSLNESIFYYNHGQRRSLSIIYLLVIGQFRKGQRKLGSLWPSYLGTAVSTFNIIDNCKWLQFIRLIRQKTTPWMKHISRNVLFLGIYVVRIRCSSYDSLTILNTSCDEFEGKDQIHISIAVSTHAQYQSCIYTTNKMKPPQ